MIPRHLDHRRATDRDVARDLVQILHYHPWGGLSVWALAKKLGRSSPRIKRILESDPIFTINYHALVDEGRTRWVLSDRYWTMLQDSK